MDEVAGIGQGQRCGAGLVVGNGKSGSEQMACEDGELRLGVVGSDKKVSNFERFSHAELVCVAVIPIL